MILVVLFFIISFLAIGGTYLNIDPYDNLIWIKTIIHFMFLIFTMTAIPFCYRKFTKNPNVKKGKKICAWNCLIILGLYFIIDVIIMGGIFDETFQNLGSNSVYALMFWYINRKLFLNDNKATAKTIPPKSEKEIIENTLDTPALDIDKMSPQEAAEYLVAEQLGEKYTPKEKQDKKVKIKYCSQCGSQIDPVTKKCTGCGKQYFRGLRFTKSSITVIALASVIAIVSTLGLLQYINTQELKAEISDLESQVKNKQLIIDSLQSQVKNKQSTIDSLRSQVWDNEELVDFVDDYIVFIENDGSNLYHKYECDKFVGDDCWAHNVEYAEYIGYKPCPKCCK